MKVNIPKQNKRRIHKSYSICENANEELGRRFTPPRVVNAIKVERSTKC